MNENGDAFDVSPEMCDNEMDSEHLLDFRDLQGHETELIPFCCYSQPGGYVNYGNQFPDIDGSDSSCGRGSRVV
ncbi:hypothetical protein TNCV_2983061 [Trichonephila clavipes]|nr:hypothetical protein TNCV_2983061 [Trichonephila clavipes]